MIMIKHYISPAYRNPLKPVHQQ